ncbi:AAA family ATPase [Paenibacillus alvei]|uniref:AAA family ATPase n=1 Tax=Paenibacillus alvei TaxID=44250 RepID=UPI0022818830|nr:AAA family ATPase [Paenibacillus alvei]MBG9736698.1 DNA helicase [Paenibacillus alvei]MBG9745839.1 DNA helicase [Paenibacillus alvei]MCY9577976.1 AAA family ATPase [Paenibacillus alvei]MCY9583153.1 AAA family ATPase [Paenibacillus alvei]
MANYGEQFLSKAVDNNDVQAFVRFSIEESDFPTEAERKAYRFIREYSEQNRGQAPSYATFQAENPDIVYIPDVTDSFEYMARMIKSFSAKLQTKRLIEQEFPKTFAENDGLTAIELLKKRSEEIIQKTQVRTKIANTLDDLGTLIKTEYQRRKEGKSFKMWKTPFNTLDTEIGGLFSGDVYGVMAESGRGKTYLTIKFIDSLLRQGANVFVKSFEVKAYGWLSRLISVMTAEDGVITMDDTSQVVGLPNKAILTGNLDEELEQYFIEMLDRINEYYPGKLYLQAKGDPELTRSLRELEQELQLNPDIDVVVIDPFYSLSDVYGRNANNTTGGAADYAARKLEWVIGEYDVVGMYTVQATVEKKERTEEERREIILPTRDRLKTTKALLDISTNLFSFDSADGLAKLGVEKGRNGAEDVVIELSALLDYGILKENSVEETADRFQLPL